MVEPDSVGIGAVGILAGGGPLPARVAQTLLQSGRKIFVIGFEGFADPALLAPYPHRMVRLAAAGEILAALRTHHCHELVLIGPVRRPAWRDLRPDREGMGILARLGRAVFAGDDGLLGAVIRVLEEEGFIIHGAHEILQDDTGCEGPLGIIAPDARALSDMAHAAEVLAVMAPLDIGQSCVVQGGLVLALEALEGTDRMLERCAALKHEGPGGVLVKMPKKGQDLRADMPTIGPLTVRHVAAAGLRGVAFAAGQTLLVNYPACVAEADRLGLFLYGMLVRAEARSALNEGENI